MKREGRQHGMVRINRNKLLRIAHAGADDDAAAMTELGALGRAPSKPTNASRSTGKCRRPRCASCHHHPVTKARDKAKGAHKLRACDVALNHRLVSWRVVGDGAPFAAALPNYKGVSATAVLAYLAGGSSNSWHQDEDDDESDSTMVLGNSAHGAPSDVYDFILGCHSGARADEEEADLMYANHMAVGDTDATTEQGEEAEEDDELGFCMVGVAIAIEYSDGEDWLVVEEI